MKRKTSAFTLIEMLTVIAISAVLLTIIVVPIIQSFNMTRAAEAFSDAQDKARLLTDRIARDISNAVAVRGTNGSVSTTLNGVNVSLPSHSEVVQVPGKDGTTVERMLEWVKLDIVPPAQGLDSIDSSGAFIDPVTGKKDPTLKAPKGQVQVPVIPATSMIRYFVGLRDPSQPYNDPYSGILMASSGTRDNLYVLYRSVAVAYIPPIAGPFGTATRQVNTALFDVDANGEILMDDPRFMVMDRDGAGNILQNDHNMRVYHWMGQKAPWDPVNPLSSDITHNPTNFAHTVLQTEVSRYDMIMPQYNTANHVAVYDGNVPRLTPMIQLRPTVFSNDPAAGQVALRLGQENDNAKAIAPDVFKTQYGLWNQAIVRAYPGGYLPNDPNHNGYSVAYAPATGVPSFGTYFWAPSFGGTEFTNGKEVFDNFTYDDAVSLNEPYPFTAAALASNSRSAWLSDPAAHLAFTPFDLLTGSGTIRTSFSISEVGVNPLPNDPDQNPNRPNLPQVYLTSTPVSALNDTGAGAVWSGPGYDINQAFNRSWSTYSYMQPNLQRFIDLRVTPNEDGTYGPLYPLNPGGTVTDFQLKQPDGSMLDRCRIVPGSDVVTGPDQNPGPNYGHPVRYTRVTHIPGPNQYRINYVDQPEPREAGSGTVDGAAYQNAFNLTNADVAGFDVDAYDPTNFVSAVLQPRFKAGYIQLNSDPGLPLPDGYAGGSGTVKVPFKVEYRFQFTGVLPSMDLQPGATQSEVFSVDYDTRQLMQVLLTIRNYPQSNLPNPQTVTLKATAALRNMIR